MGTRVSGSLLLIAMAVGDSGGGVGDAGEGLGLADADDYVGDAQTAGGTGEGQTGGVHHFAHRPFVAADEVLKCCLESRDRPFTGIFIDKGSDLGDIFGYLGLPEFVNVLGKERRGGGIVIDFRARVGLTARVIALRLDGCPGLDTVLLKVLRRDEEVRGDCPEILYESGPILNKGYN